MAKIKFKKVFFIAILTFLVSGFVYFADHNFNFAPASLAGAGHNLTGFAWSETIGWISFNSKNCDTIIDGFSDGTPPGCPLLGTPIFNYGVNIDPVTGNLSGYAWSENIGWIKFGPFDPAEIYPSSPNNSAKLDIATNQITGWARACAGTVNIVNGNGDCTGASRTDGWDGWIKMAGAGSVSGSYGVTRSSGANCGLSGYAWGSDVVGGISFKGIAGNGSPYGVSSTFCEPGSEPEPLCVWDYDEYGDCLCPQETKIRTRYKREDPSGTLSCVPMFWIDPDPVECTAPEKNSCRDFNYREVAP